MRITLPYPELEYREQGTEEVLSPVNDLDKPRENLKMDTHFPQNNTQQLVLDVTVTLQACNIIPELPLKDLSK